MQDELCYIFCCWVYMSSEDRSWAPRSSYLKRRTNHADVGIKNCPCWSLIWQHLTRVCYKNLCGAVQLFQEKLARPMQRKTIRHGPLKKQSIASLLLSFDYPQESQHRKIFFSSPQTQRFFSGTDWYGCCCCHDSPLIFPSFFSFSGTSSIPSFW